MESDSSSPPLSPWVECFAMIKFDLDIGPKIDFVYPPHVLSEKGEKVLLFHAFPDCNVNTNHNFIYFFTVEDGITVEGEQELQNEVSVLSSSNRLIPSHAPHTTALSQETPLPLSLEGSAVRSGHSHPSEGSASLSPTFGNSTTGLDSTTSGGRLSGSPSTTTNTTATPQRLLYGTVYFRQKKDSRVHRGYVQEAVVLLSRLNYFSVSEVILRVVMPKCAQCCPESPDVGTLENNPIHLNPNDLRVVVDEEDHQVVIVDGKESTPPLSGGLAGTAAGSYSSAANNANIALVSSPFAPTPCNFCLPFDPSFNNNNYSQEDVLRMAYEEIRLHWPSPHPRAVYSNLSLLSTPISFVTPAKMRRSAAGGSFNNKNANFFNSNNNTVHGASRAPTKLNQQVSFIEDNKFYGSAANLYVDPYYSGIAGGGSNPRSRSSSSFYSSVLDTLGLGSSSGKGGNEARAELNKTNLTAIHKSPVESEAFPLYKLFKHILHYLTRIWELLLWNESILLVSSSPMMASAGALGISSLILPIQYNGIIKSYFTVQNADYNVYARLGKDLKFNDRKSIIIAVTNPYFVNHYSGWKSLLVVMDNYLVESTQTIMNTKKESQNGSNGGGGGLLQTKSNTMATISTNQSSVSEGNTGGNPPTAEGAEKDTTADDRSEKETKSTQKEGPLSCDPIDPDRSSSSMTMEEGDKKYSFLNDEETRVSSYKVRLRSSSSDEEIDDGYRFPVAPVSEKPQSILVRNQGGGMTSFDGASVNRSRGKETVVKVVEVPPLEPRGPSITSGNSSTGIGFNRELSEYSMNTSTAGSSPTNSHRPEEEEEGGGGSGGGDGGGAPSNPSAKLTEENLLRRQSHTSDAFTFEEYRKIHRHTKETAKKSVHKTNVSHSRSKLQYNLRSYFDTSFNHFLLDHKEQTKILLHRLEAVSKFDGEGQQSALLTHKRRFYGINAPKINNTNNSNHNSSGGGGGKTLQSPEDARERDFNLNHNNSINYLLFSQFSIADEILRKYFSSLTSEFLSPITVWYRSVVYGYCSPFDLSFLDSIVVPLDRVPSPQPAMDGLHGDGSGGAGSGGSAGGGDGKRFKLSAPPKLETKEENLYLNVLQLCDRNFLDKYLLPPVIFLTFFERFHRQVAPPMWTANHSYKTYKQIYESFCNGILFVNFVYQLIDESLSDAFQHFEIDIFLQYYPTEESRIDFFITIYKYLQALVEKCIDPDVLQVRAVTSVLAAVASSIQSLPLRENFMEMIEGLRL